jgi:hypothetical protein
MSQHNVHRAREWASCALLLRIAVDRFAPRRGDREARSPGARAQGLDRDQLEAVGGRPARRRWAPVLGHVAGVAAARHVQVA